MGVMRGMAALSTKGAGHEHLYPAVARAICRAIPYHVRYSVAAGSAAKSPLGLQCPGAALWMAFQLDLAGDSASHLAVLQGVSGDRGVSQLHLTSLLWLYDFCGRNRPRVVPPAGPMHSPERPWRGPVAVQHCPRQLLGPRRVALDLAAPHRPTSRLCAQPCRPQRGCGSVPASVARTKPQRPNGPRAVSAPL